MAKKKETEEKSVNKIRIKLKSYDSKLIDEACRQIVEIGERYGIEIKGPIPLPTEIHRYTVNRSPFVHKDAREQFEVRIHKRIIDLKNITPTLIDSLQNLNLPSGVEIEIKLQ
ncbi:30S ribosomal protein S10 [Candidatus Parcubacteria bacterium]|nr:30S ribosomal protein S10 [Candidatus Parcubacteria bacterium]